MNEYPNCVVPCPRPVKKFSILRTLKLLITVVIFTVIIITWGILIEQCLREVLHLGDSLKDALLVAVLFTIIGIGIVKMFNINIEDAIGIDI